MSVSVEGGSTNTPTNDGEGVSSGNPSERETNSEKTLAERNTGGGVVSRSRLMQRMEHLLKGNIDIDNNNNKTTLYIEHTWFITYHLYNLCKKKGYTN